MPGRGRRRRSRTPPRRYTTEPIRPQTAPARTSATLDPRRTRPAVTAIAEADVRIPQALAQTQHRRTSSGGWFRSSRNRPVTAPPVAEIVLPTTTPVASVVTSHSFRRERDGSMSSYPAATCVGGEVAAKKGSSHDAFLRGSGPIDVPFRQLVARSLPSRVAKR